MQSYEYADSRGLLMEDSKMLGSMHNVPKSVISMIDMECNKAVMNIIPHFIVLVCMVMFAVMQ